VKGFLRYLCFYCASRLMYETVRGLARKQSQKPAAAQPCAHKAYGPLLMLLVVFPCVVLAAFGLFGFYLSLGN
jgi:hypothetical protein